MKSEHALNVTPFPLDLHRAIKSQAAAEGMTLREFVITALTAMVAQKGPKR